MLDWIMKYILGRVPSEDAISRLEQRVAERKAALEKRRKIAELQAQLRQIDREERSINKIPWIPLAIAAGALCLLIAILVSC